jgi:hypothetical protein
MKNDLSRRMQTVLDVFPEEGSLSAAQVVTILRNNNEPEIDTSLPYHVRYILSKLEMSKVLNFDMWTTTYRRV